MAETLPQPPVAIATEQEPAIISWSAAIAGMLIASALSLLLFGFGGAVGLSVAAPWSNDAATTASLASVLFVAIAYIFSISVGGYFAGRLRPRASLIENEARFRDGANGLVTWSASLAAGVIVAGLIASSAAQTIAAGAGAAGTAAAPYAERTVDTLLRPAPAESAAASDAEQTSRPILRGASISEAESASLSEQERAQVVRIVGRGLMEGEVPAADRAYLSQLLVEEYGYEPEAADQTVNQTIDEMQTTTTEALEEARQATAFAGFWTAAVLLIAAMASWWAASLGGSHRDEALA